MNANVPEGAAAPAITSIESLHRTIRLIGIGGAAAIAVAVGAYVAWFHGERISTEPDDWARFGEYIGGFGGMLLASWTLFALVATLRIQAEQLVDTQQQLAKETKRLDEQAYTLNKQNFENTFFRLLGLLQDRLSRINEGTGDQIPKGRAAIRGFVAVLNSGHENPLQKENAEPDAVFTRYRAWHAQNAQVFDWYFPLIHQILRSIERSGMHDRQTYSNILWAVVSPAEKHLLFYHGLTGPPNEPGKHNLTADDFGTLIKRYRMLGSFDLTQVAVIPAARAAWYDAITG